MKEAEAARVAKESELFAMRFGIDTKEPSAMRIGEAIDEYEKFILGKGDVSTANNIRCMKKAVNAYRGLTRKWLTLTKTIVTA